MAEKDTQDDVSKVHRHDEALEKKRFDLAVKSEMYGEDYSAKAGMIGTSAAQTIALNNQNQNPNSEKNRERRLFEKLVLQSVTSKFFDDMKNWSVEQHEAVSSALIDWFRQRAAEDQKRADEIQLKIKSDQHFVDEAKEMLQAHENGKPVDQNKARQLIEMRTGKPAGELPLVVLLNMMKEELPEAQEDLRNNRTAWESLRERIRVSETEAQRLEEGVGRIQKLPREEQKAAYRELFQSVPSKLLEEFLLSDTYKNATLELKEAVAERDKELQQEKFQNAGDADNLVGGENSKLAAKQGTLTVDFQSVAAPAAAQEKTLTNTPNLGINFG